MSTFTWSSAANGDWSSGGLWNPAGPPTGTGNEALINAVGGPYKVSYDEKSSTIGSLVVNSANATLSFGPGDTLALSQALTVTAGIVDVTAGAKLSANDQIVFLGVRGGPIRIF